MLLKNIINFRNLLIAGLISVSFSLLAMYYPIQVGDKVASGINLWKHRCNSLDSALYYSRIFNGIEIDAVFSAEFACFDVRHDIEAPYSHLDLWTIIDSTKLSGTMYWIDLKNLKQSNVTEIIAVLDSYVINDSSLKKRMIIESNVPDALNELSKKGYHTSYWVPHYDNSLIGYIKFFVRTKPMLIKYKFNALSAHYRMLPFLSFFYPEHNFHVWTDDSNNSQFLPILDSVRNNTSIKVILVDYLTPPIPILK